jgi:hypothetical protein
LFKQAKEILGGGASFHSSHKRYLAPRALLTMLLNDALQGGGGGIMGAVGRLASKHGGKTGELGNMASLAGRFSTLGSSGGMISKFISILLSYVQGKGSNEAMQLLQKALPSK